MATAKIQSKPKLLELDLVRAVAILAVVAIHATSEATVELPFGSRAQLIYLAINKLCNFAVPVFILVSGLVLFYRYDNDWGGKQALQFYMRRVKQVLFPYLLWSFFYYLYNQWVFDRANLHLDWAEFGALLPWADASYHLYFMVIIVQFYLLFPLLMWACRTFSWFRSGLIWIGLFIHAAFYSYNHWVEPIDHMTSLCVDYFSMFALGGWMGLHYETFAGWLRRNTAWVVPLTFLLGIGFAGLYIMEGRMPFPVEGTWYQVLFFGYAAFASFSLIRFGQILLGRAKLAAQIGMALGAGSFGVYLMHPAVLTYWRVHMVNHSGAMLMYHLYTLGSFLVSLAMPWAAVFLYGKAVRKRQHKQRETRSLSV